MEILTLAGSQHYFQTKIFKFCCNSPPKWFYSPWRVDWNIWVSDDHSSWRVMKLAMASCPEFRKKKKKLPFSLKSTGFIMLNPIWSDSDPNTTQRWTKSQLLQKFRISDIKTLFWIFFENVDLSMWVSQDFCFDLCYDSVSSKQGGIVN